MIEIIKNRIQTKVSIIGVAALGSSVLPKPLFWFRSNTETETQIG